MVLEELLLGDLLVDEDELGRLLDEDELGVLVEPAPALPLMPDELLLEAPLEPVLDLLKCASHSEREICPSLFLSTSEKLGVDADEDAPWLLEVPPAADDGCDEVLELVPAADGVLDEDDGVDEDGLDFDDEDCATASDDRANRTAAVMILRVLGMEPPGV